MLIRRHLVEAADFVVSRACNDAHAGEFCGHPACEREWDHAERLREIADWIEEIA